MDTDELYYVIRKLDKEIAELARIGLVDPQLQARRDQQYQKLRECWYESPMDDDTEVD